MSFLDIINQEQEKLKESMGGNNKVVYPKTKHQRLFFNKNQQDILMQVLPSADLVSAFAEPIRKIFLSTRTSQGKQLNVNFTLSPDGDPASILEPKIEEWADKGMIPNGFGGQTTPRRLYLVNVVQIVQDQNGQWVQERDSQGNLVVRLFEMPQSAYQNLLRKLQDPMYNVAGSDFSFMDINRPSPIKISKPAKGQMEYPVEVYTNITLPPLGQGWESQLEDLKAHAVPTEYLENGADWVQAFIDMKEGRKPNQRNRENQTQTQGQQQPQVNPYAQQVQQPQQTAVPQQQAQPMNSTPTPTPAPPQQPTGGDIGVEASLNFANNPNPNPSPSPAPQQPMNDNPSPVPPTQPTAPQQPAQAEAPSQPEQAQAPHNVDLNSNGLQDIDAMLEKELNGGA